MHFRNVVVHRTKKTNMAACQDSGNYHRTECHNMRMMIPTIDRRPGVVAAAVNRLGRLLYSERTNGMIRGCDQSHRVERREVAGAIDVAIVVIHHIQVQGKINEAQTQKMDFSIFFVFQFRFSVF
jgi:hypothetical protein